MLTGECVTGESHYIKKALIPSNYSIVTKLRYEIIQCRICNISKRITTQGFG